MDLVKFSPLLLSVLLLAGTDCTAVPCDGNETALDQVFSKSYEFRIKNDNPSIDSKKIEALARRYSFALSFEGQAADSVLFRVGEASFSLRIVKANEESFYLVRPFSSTQQRSETDQRPFHLTVSSKIWSGGIAKDYYLKEADIKAMIRDIRSMGDNNRVALALETKEGKDFLIQYRDTSDKKGLHRTVEDIILPRPYVLSKWIREKIHSKHQITLAQLDQIFSDWDGKSIRDTEFKDVAHMRYRLQQEHASKDVSWFLGTLDGSPVRVVIITEPEKLPHVVTAYRVSDRKNQNLLELMSESSN